VALDEKVLGGQLSLRHRESRRAKEKKPCLLDRRKEEAYVRPANVIRSDRGKEGTFVRQVYRNTFAFFGKGQGEEVEIAKRRLPI